MRRGIQRAAEEESNVDITPMLDVVFIMLIFFIVTANFVKDPGLEVSRPDSTTSETQDNAGILIALGGKGEIWIDGRRIDVRQVKANVLRLKQEKPEAAVVIRADREAIAEDFVQVMDGVRAAGIRDISIGTEEN